jgi:hypothetical protein
MEPIMNSARFGSTLLASALALLAPSLALADDKAKVGGPKPTDTTKTTAATKDTPAKSPSATASQRTSTQVMAITQQALGHISDAVAALDKGNTAAATTALDKGQRVLQPLYDTPALIAVLNELDEAIASVQSKQPALKALDLAPLAASLASYQEWVDPSIAARIDEAKTSAKKGDTKATMEALRLARNRVAIDIAFLPVEEAYIRISAAQHALDDGDAKRAKQLLRTLPIVVSEVQLSTPLVPVRFKLNAAALAAEAQNWKRSQALIREAVKEMRDVEKASKRMSHAADASALVDDLEKLDRKMSSEARPQPQEIRDLAQRTRDLGA